MKRYDNYVVIIPIKGMKVLVQRQFKPGVKKYCWGFPAGFTNGNENPLTTARRELLEETGLLGNLQKVGKYYDNVSRGSENFTIYFARNIKIKRLNFINPDENETKIDNKWIQIDKLKKIKMLGACMSLAKEILLNHQTS